jgi:Putative  PD-(D/E)XK family member, (DUF4420)
MTWSEMRSFVDAEEPSKHVISGQPKLVLRLPGKGEAIELLVPVNGDPPRIEPLAEVGVDVVQDDGAEWVRLRTAVPTLFPLLYEFALVVADRAQEQGVDVRDALAEAVGSWRRLLQTASMISRERQTGLYGELLLLRRLESAMGATALDAWTGPTREAHDFRLGNTELEVKTTRGERRVHTITSTSQLDPSPGARLFVASFQVAAAGTAGESLSGLISDVRERCAKHGLAARFSQLIQNECLISPDMEPYYSERLKLRTPIALVPVDGKLPRITAEDVTQIPRPEMSRVSNVGFRLDLEGLGYLDGSPEVLAILPRET